MIADFHFIRPFWLLFFGPFVVLAWYLLRQTPVMHAWKAACDRHLLPHIMHRSERRKRIYPLLLLLMSASFMIISLGGPTWSRMPVPTYQQIQPRVLVLDMSDAMMDHDLMPDRLSRAKFKLHDLLQQRDAGQFGLVVYTDEPFVVSPLTDDGQTIEELVSSLTPDIMPVKGNRLDRALEQAGALITQTGAQYGQILVFTADEPSVPAVDAARVLAQNGIHVSVMPVRADQASTPLFSPMAKAGRGVVIPFTDTATDFNSWLAVTYGSRHYEGNVQNDIPVWRDQGRWFIIPALCLMLPVFRRGWLQRIST